MNSTTTQISASRDRRRGFALPLVLFAMVILGTVITGVFYSATVESQLGGNTAAQEEAFRVAEYGLNKALSAWSTSSMVALATGGSTTFVYDSSTFKDTVKVTRISSTNFQLTSSATVRPNTLRAARRMTGVGVKLVGPDMNMKAALMTQSKLTLGGSSLTSGVDTNPTGWSACSAASGSLAGIYIDDDANISYSGCADLSCVEGSPKVQENADAKDTTNYFVFGDMTWSQLTTMATKQLVISGAYTQMEPKYTASGACDTSQEKNWGDPSRATPTAGKCESYWPIIWIKNTSGTVNIAQGKGQGILLIESNLKLTGNFEWYGPVIVRGTLETSGTGNKVYGGVKAANVNLGSDAVLGNAVIQYSSCSVSQAVLGASSPWPLTERPWMDMFYDTP
jgi:Tfp pilus assembly protein PilX